MHKGARTQNARWRAKVIKNSADDQWVLWKSRRASLINPRRAFIKRTEEILGGAEPANGLESSAGAEFSASVTFNQVAESSIKLTRNTWEAETGKSRGH